MRRLFAVSLALFALGCVSLSDPLGHRDALTDAQKRYTDLIRWRDAAKAASYVDPDLRQKFLDEAKALDLLQISDYECGEIEYGDNDETATVAVTYHGYALNQLVERTVEVTQEWHRSDGDTWLVKPDIDAVVAALEGTPL